TFMQVLPFKERLQRVYFPLYPLAFESLSFGDFDLVISSSTRFAHGIVTKPGTKHICYMHSPGRMFWEPREYFGERSKLKILLTPALASLRLWDFAAAQRVDRFLTNSCYTAEKIKKYYHREAGVIYPPVDLSRFELGTEGGNYFLVVSRLLYWKRVDLAIRAAQELGVPLRIVGDGPERRRLEKLGQEQVEFLGWVSGGELATLYRGCWALVMPQEEDLGIVSIEAQAVGKPVISFRGGGALETV
ncbi:MAG: glycosyltransferase, partial [Candidatus Aenigmarchaeota archaeon]|nr:glycosyltransferase [Candidatus Aenigmarchaeota archaeon]